MSKGVLYTYPNSFRAQKALVASEFQGSVKLTVPSDFVFGDTNKSQDFLKKFPLGKVPAFEGSDGTLLFESNAIAHYVANEQLRGGTDEFDRAQVLQWMSFADCEILPAVCNWTFPCLGILPFNKSSTENAKDEIKSALTALDTHLKTRTYLVGQRITLADIVVACNLLSLYRLVMDASFRKPFVNVNRWFFTVVNQPQMKKVVGDVVPCVTMAVFDTKKNVHCKKEAVKKVEPQHKPADSPVVVKDKDPFAGAPASNFDFDDFKRFYSNNKEAISVPYFWEKFDSNNFSIWKCDYKYSNELEKVFMSCNLMSGMIQRLDKLRKNAFASLCLFGSDNDSTISGIWVWRGPSLVFELCEDWQTDYCSYDWERLDSDSPETKKLVEQYFKWEGTDVSGRAFNQGKIFK